MASNSLTPKGRILTAIVAAIILVFGGYWLISRQKPENKPAPSITQVPATTVPAKADEPLTPSVVPQVAQPVGQAAKNETLAGDSKDHWSNLSTKGEGK